MKVFEAAFNLTWDRTVRSPEERAGVIMQAGHDGREYFKIMFKLMEDDPKCIVVNSDEFYGTWWDDDVPYFADLLMLEVDLVRTFGAGRNMNPGAEWRMRFPDGSYAGLSLYPIVLDQGAQMRTLEITGTNPFVLYFVLKAIAIHGGRSMDNVPKDVRDLILPHIGVGNRVFQLDIQMMKFALSGSMNFECVNGPDCCDPMCGSAFVSTFDEPLW